MSVGMPIGEPGVLMRNTSWQQYVEMRDSNEHRNVRMTFDRGELELMSEDGTPSGAVLRAGEFLFPNESLRAAPAPSTVRASRGGALVLLAERGVAQELLVTCPPLLEIFAGM